MNSRQVARRLEHAREMARTLERVGCQFFACPGPQVIPIPMATCCVCWDLHRAYRLYPDLKQPAEPSTTGG